MFSGGSCFEAMALAGVGVAVVDDWNIPGSTLPAIVVDDEGVAVVDP